MNSFSLIICICSETGNFPFNVAFCGVLINQHKSWISLLCLATDHAGIYHLVLAYLKPKVVTVV